MELIKKENNSLEFNNQKDYLQILIDSKVIKTKSLEEAFTIQQYGKELGLSTMTAFNYIYNYKGTLTLYVKAIRGLLLKSGLVTWRTLQDAMYLYSDGSFKNTSKTTITVVKDGVSTEQEDKAIDRQTIIEFTRTFPNGNTIIDYGTFEFSTASKAGLIKSDSAWANYPRNMLYARAFSYGADRVASDLTLGFYSLDEMSDVAKTKEEYITRNEDSEIISIDI